MSDLLLLHVSVWHAVVAAGINSKNKFKILKSCAGFSVAANHRLHVQCEKSFLVMNSCSLASSFGCFDNRFGVAVLPFSYHFVRFVSSKLNALPLDIIDCVWKTDNKITFGENSRNFVNVTTETKDAILYHPSQQRYWSSRPRTKRFIYHSLINFLSFVKVSDKSLFVTAFALPYRLLSLPCAIVRSFVSSFSSDKTNCSRQQQKPKVQKCDCRMFFFCLAVCIDAESHCDERFGASTCWCSRQNETAANKPIKMEKRILLQVKEVRRTKNVKENLLY